MSLTLEEDIFARLFSTHDPEAAVGCDVGTVLARPEKTSEEGTSVFSVGTVGRVVASTRTDEGIELDLEGEIRFEILGEDDVPESGTILKPLPEPDVNESDAGILAMRRELVLLTQGVADATGDRFPIDSSDLEPPGREVGFEELVNRLAAGIDLPALRKLELLREALPERAVSLADVLRSRLTVLTALEPFRHLAQGAETN